MTQPTSSLGTFKIDNFSGGINLVDPDSELLPEELGPASQNVELMGAGMRLRSRRPVYTMGLSGTAPPTHSSTADFSSIATFRLLAGQGDSIIVSNDNGKVFTFTLSTPSVGAQVIVGSGGPGKEWVFEQAADTAGVEKVYMLNGVDAAQAFTISGATVAAWAGAPPNGKVLKVWKTLMCVAGVTAFPARLYYSRPNDPENFTAPGGFIDIKSTDDDVEEIIGLEVIGENLLVFKRNSVWLVFDPVSFDNRRIAGVGLLNRSCTTSFENRVYWASIAGLYSTDGDTVTLESRNVQPVFDTLDFASASLTRVTCSHDGRVMLLKVSGSYRGLWVMDGAKSRQDGQHPWFFHGGPNCIPIQNCRTLTRAVGDIPGLGAITPLVIGMFYRSSDNKQFPAAYFNDTIFLSNADWLGDDILLIDDVDALLDSAWLRVQGDENKERLRRVSFNGTGRITVSFYTDFAVGALFSSTLANASPQRFRRVRPETRGRFHKIRVAYTENSVAAPMLLDDIEIKYRGGKEH